ncbi:MAG: hypothetical protein Q4A63_01575 [Butyricicoccus pullicaecorum]|nr:hypothetical protein [Butyricicoccus pullicaecorum]MDO4668485.1 hypothetical protein [Butyricicoccus pullicaecorum]
MTKQWIRRTSVILCGAMLCAGAAQANVYIPQSSIAAEQEEQVTRNIEDYRVSLGSNGREKEFCRESIGNTSKVTVMFKGTGGPEEVKICIYQGAGECGKLMKSEVLSLRDAVTVSVDGDEFDEFYVTATVTKGMGGNATFQIS